MAAICSCTDGIKNLQQPSCVDSFLRDSRLIFVNYLDDSGAVNSIKSTDTLDSTFFEGKWNATDKSQRWYPTDTINNVVGLREDNVTQDIDTIPFNVRQGNRMYDGTFYGGIASPTFEKALESMSCQQMGFFIIDVAGEIIGLNNSLTGDLDPIKIQRNTFQFKYTFPSATEVQSVQIKFMWEENEQDSDLNYIAKGEISVDMLTQIGMSTVVFETPATAITTTTATFVMNFEYGTQFVKLPYEGAVIGDFVLIDAVGVPVVITSVTPTLVTNVYDMVFPIQGSGDIVLSYQKTVGVGFESTTDLIITIP